jgi:Skp family chaperone for outer membrane proteins
MGTGANRHLWRATVLGLVGGTALGGLGVGLSRLTPTEAQQPPGHLTRPVPDETIQTRSEPLPHPLPAPVVSQQPSFIEADAVIPASAAIPTLPPTQPVIPAVPPAIPQPVIPSLPPPPGFAPPAPPIQPPEPPQPVSPARSDFNLRPGNGGNSVNYGGTIPVTNSKPPTAPLGTYEKYEFSLPARPDPIPRATDQPGSTGPDTDATAPGDHIMNLKQTALATAIGGALAFAPATSPAAFPVPPLAVPPTSPVVQDANKDKTVEQRLEDIEKKIDEFTELLRGRKDSQGFPLESDPGLVTEMRQLKDEIDKLRKQIEEMQKTTTALRPQAADPKAGKGTVRIVNDYPVEITMVVNERSYRVAPNAKLEIDVPAGEFTYQLLNAGVNLTPTRTTVEEKKVVTLRVK